MEEVIAEQQQQSSRDKTVRSRKALDRLDVHHFIYYIVALRFHEICGGRILTGNITYIHADDQNRDYS